MKKIVLFSLIFIQFSVIAQQKIDSLNVVDKIDYVIKNNNKFKTFKVIPIEQLIRLKKQVKDSVLVSENKIGKQLTEISELKSTLETKQNKINELNKSLDETNSNIDKLDFVGSKMKISNYHTLVWSIIAVLTLGLLFFLFQYKNSNKVTKDTKIANENLNIDFEDYKRKAIEREQKIKRQLQDEINKNNKQ